MKIKISSILIFTVIAFCVYLFISSIKAGRQNIKALYNITHTDFSLSKRDTLLYPADFLDRVTNVRTDYYESNKIVQSFQISDSLEIFIIELLNQKPVIGKPEILNKEMLNPVGVTYISNNFGNFDLQVAFDTDTAINQIAFFSQDGHVKDLFSNKTTQAVTISTSAIGYRNVEARNFNTIIRPRKNASRQINGCAFFHIGELSTYIGFIIKDRQELSDAFISRETLAITSFIKSN